MRNADAKPIDINCVVLLTQEQATSRYNIGKTNIRKIADEAGAIVCVGAKILYHRPKLDKYFENVAV